MANPVSYSSYNTAFKEGPLLISTVAPHAAALSYAFSYLLRNLYRMLVGTKPGQHITQTTPSVILPNQCL